MTEEKVYFKNPRGVKLCGILSNPTASKTSPIVVLCHGFSVNKGNFTNTRLVPILRKEGISTFKFDFFGHGESEGRLEDITITEGVEDALSAIKYLKSLDYSRIGLFGTSFGGLIGLMVASKINDLYLLALKSPVSNSRERNLDCLGEKLVREWKEKGFRFFISGDGKKHKINYAFFEDKDNNNGYEAAEKIEIPAYIVHGDKDEIIPIKQSIKTSQILSNGKLEIIKGAGHTYDEPGKFDQMINLIAKFIIDNSK